MRLFLIPLLVLVAPLGAARAGGDDPYLQELRARSESLGLADTPAWHALLHYHARRLGPGVRSRADDPDFFLAADGRRDPAAELAATLEAFFAPEPQDSDAEHPQCRFVARYRWLDERLGFDPARLPAAACPAFEEWLAHFAAERLTLVFPEAFINNPASMFGHTLLRVDAPGPAARSDLLAYAINFAALTGGEQGMLYTVKGLTGLYPGHFSVAPYYEKVKAYGDWENRDIWEYHLDFSPAEIQRVLEHLWELREIRFDYWFLDENCSYQLLDLLEVGRPGLALIEGNPLYLIPADSVRRVSRDAALVSEVDWRPSAATRLRHAERQLSALDQRRALDLARGALDPASRDLAALPDAERAALLTVAYDYLRYHYLSRRRPSPEAQARSRRLLVARSRVDVLGDAPDPPAPAVRPDQGHATARLAVGCGWWNDRPYVEARFRPAFHHRLDPEGGYTRGAQIQFLETALRYYPEQNQLRLHELVLLDIESLAPRDRFFKPISWGFDTGLRTRLVEHHGEDLRLAQVFRTHGGVGLAWEAGSGLLHGALHGVADLGPKLEDDYALGYGADLGYQLGSDGDRWKGNLIGRITHFPLGDETTRISLGLEQRLSIGRDRALELRTSWERGFGRSWAQAELRFNVYF